jgi:two-component system chemotaxis response regulator CheB
MSGRQHKLKVLVVEDSLVSRRLMTHILNSDSELEVVAEASNGDEAVELTLRCEPDVIVMDVVMPSMDGLEATRRIMRELPTPIVLTSSSYEPGDLSKSFEALSAGALTLLAKPSGPEAPTFAAEAAALTITVKLMAEVKLVRRRSNGVPPPRPVATPPSGGVRPQRRPAEIVAIAASTGGPVALAKIMGALPVSTPAPILVVQHITPGFHQGLADWLDGISPLSVRLAQDGAQLRAGEVLVAPADAHLGVTAGERVALSTDPPISGHRPSATYMFQSVASTFGSAAIAAILTGMGEDGVAGLVALSERGGLVLAQDEATSVVFGMPRKAASLGIVDDVLPIEQIAGALIAATDGERQL